MVGSSGGGHVALQVASAVPDRVRQVILLCTAADGIEPTPTLRARWADERALLEAGDLDDAARLNADQWLSFPVTVVTGAHDLDFFAAVAHHLMERLPLARSIELDWTGHLPNLERPAEVSALLAEELSDPGVR